MEIIDALNFADAVLSGNTDPNLDALITLARAYRRVTIGIEYEPARRTTDGKLTTLSVIAHSQPPRQGYHVAMATRLQVFAAVQK